MGPAADRRTPHPRRDWVAAAFLAGVALFAFAPALDCGFVNLDDPYYVTSNQNVSPGLSLAGFRWALTATDVGNWHPLTWLSLQLDASLWPKPDGTLDPFGFHLTSVLLHAANAALLFLALRALTGAFWPSAVVALLFAVHPLRAESVAWVSERKDVLSIFFGLLALWAYADYVKRPSGWRYLAMAAALAASLMCKPMLVTFPFLLLVLDWWPLGRVRTLADWRRPAVEKLPLIALVAVSSVVAYKAQSTGGAVAALETFSLDVRAENAAVSYVQYLLKTAWPMGLAVYYPHLAQPWSSGLPAWKVGGAAVLLVALTAAAVALWRKAPYVLAGWLWYLGTLVPVIGLLQVGDQAYADRYSYFPQVGILIALCWGVADLARRKTETAVAVAAAVAVVLVVLTRLQVATWHDSTSLWQHDLRVAGPSPLAYMNLGVAQGDAGKNAAAIESVRKAIEVYPKAFLPHLNLGELLSRVGDLQGAADEFEAASKIQPERAEPLLKQGDVLARMGRLEEAAKLHEQATRVAADSAAAWCQLALAEMALKRYDRSKKCFDKALELQPTSAQAHCGLGKLLLEIDKNDPEGLEQLNEAVRCDPGYGEGHLFLGIELDRRGDPACFGHFEKAVRYSPGDPDAWFQLGRALAGKERWRDAVECLEEAVKLAPGRRDYAAALKSAHANFGRRSPLLPPVPGKTP
jgi:tetratricopeptide (TPR) repeat protein